MMGEMSDEFRALREHKNKTKWKRDEENRRLLRGCGFTFRRGPNVLYFRHEGKPKADFFPTTGRWTSGGETFSGGAKAFLAWFSKQEA